MRLLLPVTAALVPAILLPGYSFYFDITPKLVILLVAAALALIAWDGSLFRARSAAGWMTLLLALQCGWLVVAAAWSTNSALSFNGGNWRRLGVVTSMAILVYAFLVLVDCAGRRERLVQYLRAIVLGGIPISLYAAAQYAGYDPWLAPDAYHAGEGVFRIVRPPSTLGHASYLGAYLVYVVFAGCALKAVEHARLWRVIGVCGSAVASLAIVLSGTRAALVGVAAGLAVLVVLLPAFRRPRHLIAAAALGACLLLFFVAPAGANLRSRVHWSMEEPLGGARPLLWRDTLAMTSHRVLTGYGPETFGTEFPRYESVDLARAYPDFQHESPHNVFLDALAGQGALGCLLLAATAGLALYGARASASARGTLMSILAASFVAGLAAGQFASFTISTALFFYLSAALIAALATPEPATGERPWLRAGGWAVALLFAAYGTRITVADTALASTQRALARNDLHAAVSLYRTVQRWHPAGSTSDLYFSRELANLFRRTPDVRLKLQTWTPAFQAAARAATTAEDRHDAFYNLAIFFATQNNAGDVERSLRNALYWAPSWFKPHWALSRLLLAQGRLPEAAREAETAVMLDGGKDLEVTRTLETIRNYRRTDSR